MALQHQTLAQRVDSVPATLRMVLFVVAVIGVMLIATAVFGIRFSGPSYEIVPDPAGQLGLPF